MIAAQPLGFLGCQQTFHVAVAHDEACDLQAGLFHKTGTEMNIMAQVIDAQLQPFEREFGRVTAELGRQRLFCGSSESEDGYSRHRRQSGLCSLRIAQSIDQAGADGARLIRHRSIASAHTRAPACDLHSLQTADFSTCTGA